MTIKTKFNIGDEVLGIILPSPEEIKKYNLQW